MLKPLSAAAAPPRSAPVESVTGPDSQTSPGFGDALEAAQQAAQQAAQRAAPNAQGSRAAPGGRPAPPTPDPSTATPDLDTPAAALGRDIGSATGTPATRLAGVPARSRYREDPEASPPAKPASDHRLDASATAEPATGEPAATPTVTPDSLAAAIVQAAAATTGQAGATAGADAGASQSTDASVAGSAAKRGTSTPFPAAGPDGAGAEDDAAAKQGATAASSSNLTVPAQSLLSETVFLGLPGVPTGAPSSAVSGTGKARVPEAATPISSAAAAAAASTLSALSGSPNLVSGARPSPSSGILSAGKDGTPAATAQQASGGSAPSLSTLVDTIQRTTGIEVDRIALSTGSAQAAPVDQVSVDQAPADQAPEDQTPADQAPADQAPVEQALADQAPLEQALAAAGAIDPNGSSGPLGGHSPLAEDVTDAGILGNLHRTERAVTSAQGQDGGGTVSVDPQSVDAGGIAIQAGDLPTAQTIGASAARPLAANGSLPPSVASQVAPGLVSMAQAGAGGRLSISITPDQLGQVHITVERAMDGTTSIHVAAEQLGTLNILRHDQADLTRALDQVGVGQGGHSLSFSWDGGGGGMQGWNTPGEQRGGYQPALVSKSYAVEPTAAPPAAVARGGIDLTA
jgi:hypothetical protein